VASSLIYSLIKTHNILKKLKINFYLIIFFALFPGYAMAYIDPGSMGVIYQFGFIIFYGIVGALLFFFRPVKNFFLKIFGKKNTDTEKNNPDDNLISENVELNTATEPEEGTENVQSSENS
jgi:hypothetical protein